MRVDTLSWGFVYTLKGQGARSSLPFLRSSVFGQPKRLYLFISSSYSSAKPLLSHEKR